MSAKDAIAKREAAKKPKPVKSRKPKKAVETPEDMTFGEVVE